MTQIGRYERFEEIGRGGMGTVFRARDTLLQREVALKLLPAYLSQDETFSQRFQREARVIAQLEHAHIVPVYDVGEYEKRPFLVMRLLKGGTLRQRLVEGGMTPPDLAKILQQIALALDAAHNRGVIHRDIKPSNILFDEQGATFVADFGVAKVLDATIQLTGSGVVGTPVYMSPEHFSGKTLDGRSDQYSLAVVIYEALTGEVPFSGKTIHQLIYQHLEGVPRAVHEINGNLPSNLSSVLSRALEKQPSDRFATISDFSQALTQALSTPASAKTTTRTAQEDSRPLSSPLPLANSTEGESKTTQAQKLQQYYGKGLQAFAAKEWETAKDAFAKVLEIEPNHPKARSRHQEAVKQLGKQSQNADRAAVSRRSSPPEPTKTSNPIKIVTGAGGQQAAKRRYWVWLVMAAIFVALGSWAFVSNADSAPSVVIVTRDVTATAQPTMAKATVPAAGGLPDADITPSPRATQVIDAEVETLTGPTQFAFSDGTRLDLGADTTVQVLTQSGENGETAVQLLLEQGILVVKTTGTPVFVENVYGARAEITDGLLGVQHVDSPFRFGAVCLLGNSCRLVGDIDGVVGLTEGQESFVGGSGKPHDPENADYAIYHVIASDVVPAPTATPTPTATFTPSPTPTNTPTRVPTTLSPTATATPYLGPPLNDDD